MQLKVKTSYLKSPSKVWQTCVSDEKPSNPKVGCVFWTVALKLTDWISITSWKKDNLSFSGSKDRGFHIHSLYKAPWHKCNISYIGLYKHKKNIWSIARLILTVTCIEVCCFSQHYHYLYLKIMHILS